MITIPTTLVLGAGASQPYGFPTGNKLRRDLCSSPNLTGLEGLFSARMIQLFCEKFLKSQMLSIDAFLARRGSQKVSEEISSPTFSEIGKAAIAYQLMQCEDETKLLSDHDDHWYQHLWSRINDSLEEFGSNQLRIITFNYDRSLEHYLLMSLQNAFGVTAERAGEELRKIPFLHVYGQLGGLPEMKLQGLDTRRYISNALASSQIASAASGIRVIDEHRDDDEIFAQAYGLLANAQRICFIGFGFDDTMFVGSS